MKRFIIRHDPRYHRKAAIRILDEVLCHIPNNKHIMVFIFQDIHVLENSPAGVYYVTDKLPVGANVIRSDTQHYFYRFVVFNKKKRIQTFLIPRNVPFI